MFGITPPNAETRQQPKPEHLLQVGRARSRPGEDAENHQ
jgi:hypothetical protein